MNRLRQTWAIQLHRDKVAVGAPALPPGPDLVWLAGQRGQQTLLGIRPDDEIRLFARTQRNVLKAHARLIERETTDVAAVTVDVVGLEVTDNHVLLLHCALGIENVRLLGQT